MTQWRKPGEWRCWSCREWVSNIELSNADGVCPHCDSEMDIRDEPYVEERDGAGRFASPQSGIARDPVVAVRYYKMLPSGICDDYLNRVLVPIASVFRDKYPEGKAPFLATKSPDGCRVTFLNKNQERDWVAFCKEHDLKNNTSVEY